MTNTPHSRPARPRAAEFAKTVDFLRKQSNTIMSGGGVAGGTKQAGAKQLQQDEQRTQICAIMYADIVGSTQIRPDSLLVDVSNYMRDVIDDLKDSYGLLYVNKSGDGFLALGSTVSQVAEAALSLLDSFRNRNWAEAGFSKNVEIRVGLDIGTVNLIEHNDRIIDATGKMLHQAARIEPVADPNRVFCSSKFHYYLRDEDAAPNVVSEPVGKRDLDKFSGVDFLYSLNWRKEQENRQTLFSPIRNGKNIPKIKRTIPDAEKLSFLKGSFRTIRKSFQHNSELLKKRNPHVKCALDIVKDSHFNCRVFVEGEKRAECKVWLEIEEPVGGIMYRIGEETQPGDNSFNECLRVEDDGIDIYLISTMRLRFEQQSLERMTPDEAAEALWIDFVKLIA